MALWSDVDYQDEGTSLPSRNSVNFVGSGIVATDASGKTVVTVTSKTGPWQPTNAIENYPRSTRLIDAQAFLASGALRLVGGVVIPAGRAVNSITFVSNAAAVSPTNQWFCLVDQSLNVIAKTSDDTTTAWAASSAKTLNLTSTYTPSSEIAVYCGIVVVAGTVPSLTGVSGSSVLNGLAPAFTVTSTSGLTTPASLGATATNTGTIGSIPWCYVS